MERVTGEVKKRRASDTQIRQRKHRGNAVSHCSDLSQFKSSPCPRIEAEAIARGLVNFKN